MLRRPPPLLPRRNALFLDFDGTLIEIADAPDLVQVSPGLPGMLTRLARRMNGAIAILSGRPVDELERFLAPYQDTLVGQHGLERRLADGRRMAAPLPPSFRRIEHMLMDFAAKTAGVRLENKGATLSLHFRQAPDRADECRRAARSAVESIGGPFEVIEGKMVVELLPQDGGKGTAIAGLVAVRPFSGRIPIFIGDDIADETGFRVVNRLGGISIHVGAGSTAAQHHLDGVDDVLAWLAQGLAG